MDIMIQDKSIIGIAAGDDAVITEKMAYAIGQAFAGWLMKKKGLSPDNCIIGVGTDSRTTGKALRKQVLMGILSKEVYVADCDKVSTPTLQTSITFPETRYDGAVMITAGQKPAEYNGFQFFYKQGQLSNDDLTELMVQAQEIHDATTDETLEAPLPVEDTHYSDMDMQSLYSAIMGMNICDGVAAKQYDYPLDGLHIIVDAGNGVGRFLVNDILKPLGAKTTGSLSVKPNGAFPDRVIDLSDDSSLAPIRKSMATKKGRMGLVIDPDASHFSAVDANGDVICQNEDITKMYKLIIDLAKQA